jgi:putative salt-induced outer membrane protein YdiY
MASYTFDDTFYGYNKRSSARKEDDGNVSLTYSAASGESTDSSFAGIMRALEGQEKDSEFVLKKEGAPEKLSSNTSLSGYSTDGESYLAGTELLQTIAG